MWQESYNLLYVKQIHFYKYHVFIFNTGMFHMHSNISNMQKNFVIYFKNKGWEMIILSTHVEVTPQHNPYFNSLFWIIYFRSRTSLVNIVDEFLVILYLNKWNTIYNKTIICTWQNIYFNILRSIWSINDTKHASNCVYSIN